MTPDLHSEALRAWERKHDRAKFEEMSHEDVAKLAQQYLNGLHEHLVKQGDIIGKTMLEVYTHAAVEYEFRLLDLSLIQHMIDHTQS